MRCILKRTALLFFSVILFLSITGCSVRMLDFTVVSSKNVNIQVSDAGKGKRVRGEDFVMWILSIPLGAPSLEEAVDRAIESAGPNYDALMDGVIYSKMYWYLLFARSGYVVEGTPIKTSEIISRSENEGKNVDTLIDGVIFHSSLGKDNTKAIEKSYIQVNNK